MKYVICKQKEFVIFSELPKVISVITNRHCLGEMSACASNSIWSINCVCDRSQFFQKFARLI